MALGDCTQIPYRLTDAEVQQVLAANSGLVTLKSYLDYNVPPWGVVVSGGCGQILIFKNTSGKVLGTDITNYTWTNPSTGETSNVGATISGAGYAPDAYVSPTGTFFSSLPQNVMDTINGGRQAIEAAVSSIISPITNLFQPGSALDFSQAGNWVLPLALVAVGGLLLVRLTSD